MEQPIKITGIPTRERAELRARILRIEKPDWDVRVIEQAGGTFTVIGTPPGQEPASSRRSETVDEAVATHAGATIDRVEPLLALIRQAESSGNYDAHFGKPNNSNPRFTQMTIDAVLDWQKAFVSAGSISSAVGAYQIIRGTLKDIILRRNLDLADTEIFNEALQDQMAVFLLKRRGLEEFLIGSLDQSGFINQIAKEWAGLPNMTGKSHYDGDGVNSATVTLDEVKTAVEAVKN